MGNKRRRGSIVNGTMLNDDLWIEIFSRLPTKSLQRFQCVAKHWRTLISHVSSQRRLRVLLPLSGLFLYRDRDLLSDYNLSGFFVPISPSLEDFQSRMRSLPVRHFLLHSCNGLMLFDSLFVNPGSYSVWNPTGMEFFVLPPRIIYVGRRICSLAYDPRLSPHYKVVQLSVCRIPTCIIIDVYCSITNMWSKYEIPHVGRFTWLDSSASVFYRGALHMLSKNPHHLIRYDIEKKTELCLIRLSEESHDLYSYSCIGESRGHLYYGINLECGLHIYKLIDEDTKQDKWMLKHIISKKFFDSHPLTCSEDYRGHPRPIAFDQESELIYLCMPNKILTYHPSNNNLEEICSFTDRRNGNINRIVIFAVIPCLELIRPPGGNLIKGFALEKDMQCVFS